MTDPTTPPPPTPNDDGQVRIIVAYDKDHSRIGTIAWVESAEARRLIDEGRARYADGDPEDPDAADAAKDEVAETAPAETATPDRARSVGAFGASKPDAGTEQPAKHVKPATS